MKVISLLQPWASLVVLGHKKIETRSWKTEYRGPILIHASKKKISLKEGMYDLVDELCKIPGFMEAYKSLPYGAIIGKVDLITTGVLCPPYEDSCGRKGMYFNDKGATFTDKELAFGNYSPGRWGWLLSDPVLFKEPIPVRGSLSLWDYDIDLSQIETL